jgi:hypothetical protein
MDRRTEAERAQDLVKALKAEIEGRERDGTIEPKYYGALQVLEKWAKDLAEYEAARALCTRRHKHVSAVDQLFERSLLQESRLGGRRIDPAGYRRELRLARCTPTRPVRAPWRAAAFAGECLRQALAGGQAPPAVTA